MLLKKARILNLKIYRLKNFWIIRWRTIYGKTAGSGHKNKPNAKGVTFKDRGEWIVSEGSHTQLKTPEEIQKLEPFLIHEGLLQKGHVKRFKFFLNYYSVVSAVNLCPLPIRKNGRTYVKTCTKADHFGNRCGNTGMNVEVIYAQQGGLLCGIRHIF